MLDLCRERFLISSQSRLSLLRILNRCKCDCGSTPHSGALYCQISLRSWSNAAWHTRARHHLGRLCHCWYAIRDLQRSGFRRPFAPSIGSPCPTNFPCRTPTTNLSGYQSRKNLRTKIFVRSIGRLTLTRPRRQLSHSSWRVACTYPSVSCIASLRQ